jgi:transposase InsO family protein
MTDNAFAYCGRAVAALCARLRIRHLRTRPYTPRTNGKAERFIQTLLRGRHVDVVVLDAKRSFSPPMLVLVRLTAPGSRQ